MLHHSLFVVFKSKTRLPQGFLEFFISCVELRAASPVCTASVYLALWSHIISTAGVEWMLLSLTLRLPGASLRAQEPGGTCSGYLVYACEWRQERKWRKPYCLLFLLEYRPAVTQLSASHHNSFYQFTWWRLVPLRQLAMDSYRFFHQNQYQPVWQLHNNFQNVFCLICIVLFYK